jgi:hypothetical protein
MDGRRKASVLISLGPVFTDGRFDGFLAIEKDLSEEEKHLATAMTAIEDGLTTLRWPLAVNGVGSPLK